MCVFGTQGMCHEGACVMYKTPPRLHPISLFSVCLPNPPLLLRHALLRVGVAYLLGLADHLLVHPGVPQHLQVLPRERAGGRITPCFGHQSSEWGYARAFGAADTVC